MKITLSGAITSLNKAAGDDANYEKVIYNQAVNKLYCIKDGNLAELAISGSTYSGIIVLDSVSEIATIDNATGDMYYQSINNDTYYVYKYNPQQSLPVIVASGYNVYNIYGIQFNKSDNMLYAIRANMSAPYFDFIQINPATGNTTSLSSLNYDNSPPYYSTAIDPCNNQFIFSVGGDNQGIADSNYVDQYSMTGVLIQHNLTTGMIQGLQVTN